MPFSLIPFALLVIPLLEIAAFVVIGGQIGVFPTLALVVVTAIIGSILLRVQGFGLLNRIQTEMNAGRVPARELVHGVMLLVAGILLLTPGFVTDTAGFLLFVPPVRDAVWRFVRSRVRVVGPGGATFDDGASGRGPADGRTIDLDEEEFAREPDPNTPWGDGPSGPRS
ncbi:MAG: membrane protein FxsA [Roseitalea sp.]|jgi:UPF0716 protein FxsA|nr:membrane protein FxsA [Roseitalea sp.]MBO6720882.1 membrane protein FxsA [Roseitalea sp.]MBO6743187.1 membrane protein FxsA [Roseitalea sp.]